MLISQSAILTLIASGLSRGGAPIAAQPGDRSATRSSQAMALTAIVIGLAVTALLLALVASRHRRLRAAGRDELARRRATERGAHSRRERRAPSEEEAP